jgi:hypothetical protein
MSLGTVYLTQENITQSFWQKKVPIELGSRNEARPSSEARESTHESTAHRGKWAGASVRLKGAGLEGGAARGAHLP